MLDVYAVKHKDELIRACSRSGGIFTAISDRFLNGGVVYGCVLNEQFDACHIRAEDQNCRDRMRGSKYIQSRMGDCFRLAKKDLEDGREVLFSGTSCQIAGLKAFLQKDYSNLLCIDIVCHGTPSKRVWHEYLKWVSDGRAVTQVDFRNKTEYGWSAHVESVYVENQRIDTEIFKNLFLGNNILRPACYECPYKSILHPGDITIADYWGIDDAVPDFNDNKGISLVIINTERGKAYFEEVKGDVEWVQTRIEDSMQPALKAPSSRPSERDQFWLDFENNDFAYIVKKYGTVKKPSVIRRTIREIKRKVKMLFRK